MIIDFMGGRSNPHKIPRELGDIERCCLALTA